MGVKKVARPINKAKNRYLKWLKDNNADNIDIYEGEDSCGFTYYRNITAFVNNGLIVVCFMVFDDIICIDYRDEGVRYERMSISEFNDMMY